MSNSNHTKLASKLKGISSSFLKSKKHSVLMYRVADMTKILMTGPTSGQIKILTCAQNFSSYTQWKFMIPVSIILCQILSSLSWFRFHINWTYTQRAMFKLLSVGPYGFHNSFHSFMYTYWIYLLNPLWINTSPINS
jgi:hypothetical protein